MVLAAPHRILVARDVNTHRFVKQKEVIEAWSEAVDGAEDYELCSMVCSVVSMIFI